MMFSVPDCDKEAVRAEELMYTEPYVDPIPLAAQRRDTDSRGGPRGGGGQGMVLPPFVPSSAHCPKHAPIGTSPLAKDLTDDTAEPRSVFCGYDADADRRELEVRQRELERRRCLADAPFRRANTAEAKQRIACHTYLYSLDAATMASVQRCLREGTDHRLAITSAGGSSNNQHRRH